MSFSYHSLNKFQDEKLQLLLYDYYWLLDWDGFQEIKLSLDNINILLKNMNSRLYQWVLSYINQNNFRLVAGGYRKLDVSNLNEKSSHERILKHYFSEDGKITQKYSELQVLYLDKIVKLCVDKKIKLSFINTPLHNSYYSNIPQQYILGYYDRINVLKNSYPDLIALLDFRSAVTEDKLFHDGDHLNGDGGEYFIELLSKKLFPQVKEYESGNNHY